MKNGKDWIRPARKEDVIRLSEIEIFDYRLYFYPIFRSDAYFFREKTVSALAEVYAKEPERIDHTAVYDDGIVKGFVRVSEGVIEKLFVEPSFQNRGVGGALFRYAVETLGGKRLLALEKNTGAIRFYARHGFTPTGEKQRVDDTNEFLIVLERGKSQDS